MLKPQEGGYFQYGIYELYGFILQRNPNKINNGTSQAEHVEGYS